MLYIGIAEDKNRIAETLKEKIELAPDFKVKFIAPNGKELIRQLNTDHNIDVILMDIHMPLMDGIEATARVSERWPGIQTIMCTVFEDEENIFEAIKAGAKGYLMKNESPGKLHKAIYEVLEGGAPMSPIIARKVLALTQSQRPKKQPDLKKDFNLTKREIEILDHLVKGLSYEQIANNLFISYGTVRKHVENVYRKLEVHGKVEAIRKVKGE